MPFKTWVTGELVTAADANAHWSQQAVSTFPDVASRDAAIPAPVPGQLAWITGTQHLTVYMTGAGWVQLSPNISGTVDVLSPAGQDYGQQAVAFPFTLPAVPYIMMTAEHASAAWAVGYSVATATGFQANVRNIAGSTGEVTVRVSWHAAW